MKDLAKVHLPKKRQPDYGLPSRNNMANPLTIEKRCEGCGLHPATCACAGETRRYYRLMERFREAGFTASQSSFLIGLLEEYLPLI